MYRSEYTTPDNFANNIEIYIHNDDCVPSLSLGVIAKLVDSMQEVSDLNLPFYQVCNLMAGSGLPTTQENLDIIAEILNFVSNNEKIKGKIFLLLLTN